MHLSVTWHGGTNDFPTVSEYYFQVAGGSADID